MVTQAGKPKVLKSPVMLLDEHPSALDPEMTGEMVNAMRQQWR
jgi:ABC-type polar amino acid transport system ATPase subunit